MLPQFSQDLATMLFFPTKTTCSQIRSIKQSSSEEKMLWGGGGQNRKSSRKSCVDEKRGETWIKLKLSCCKIWNERQLSKLTQSVIRWKNTVYFVEGIPATMLISYSWIKSLKVEGNINVQKDQEPNVFAHNVTMNAQIFYTLGSCNVLPCNFPVCPLKENISEWCESFRRDCNILMFMSTENACSRLYIIINIIFCFVYYMFGFHIT